MKKINGIIFLMFLVINISAQEYYVKTYPNPSFHPVVKETQDKGFIFKHQNHVTKVNKYGETQWTKSGIDVVSNSFYESLIVELEDSSFILLLNQNYSTCKFSLVKLDKYGNMIFYKPYYTNQGYPEMGCLAAFNRNDTIVAFCYTYDNDSVLKAVTISSVDGDTISFNDVYETGSYSNPKYFYSNGFHYVYMKKANGIHNRLFLQIDNYANIIDSVWFNENYPDSLYKPFAFNSNNFTYINTNSYTNIYMSFWDNFVKLKDTLYDVSAFVNYYFIKTKFASCYNNTYYLCGSYRLLEDNPKDTAFIFGVKGNGAINFFNKYTPQGYSYSELLHIISGDDYIAAIGITKNLSTDQYEVLLVKTGLNGNVTSLPSHGLAANVRVYPNPATDVLNIESNMEIANICIYNTLGVEIYKAQCKDNYTSLSVKHFPQGIYFVRVENRNGLFVVNTFIKN